MLCSWPDLNKKDNLEDNYNIDWLKKLSKFELDIKNSIFRSKDCN